MSKIKQIFETKKPKKNANPKKSTSKQSEFEMVSQSFVQGISDFSDDEGSRSISPMKLRGEVRKDVNATPRNEKEVKDNWLQCAGCSKWRIVGAVSKVSEALPVASVVGNCNRLHEFLSECRLQKYLGHFNEEGITAFEDLEFPDFDLSLHFMKPVELQRFKTMYRQTSPTSSNPSSLASPPIVGSVQELPATHPDEPEVAIESPAPSDIKVEVGVADAVKNEPESSSECRKKYYKMKDPVIPAPTVTHISECVYISKPQRLQFKGQRRAESGLCCL